jgi:predicted RNase H-like HicB family nuclease
MTCTLTNTQVIFAAQSRSARTQEMLINVHLSGNGDGSNEVVSIAEQTDYIAAAMRRAVYDGLPETGGVFGEIPGFAGVWANAATESDCEHELENVLREWLTIRVSRDLPIPAIPDAGLVAIA